MRAIRQCSRPGCEGAAVATLTYTYSESTVVVGPLASSAEPHAYDLCATHAQRLTVPRGWDVVRLAIDFSPRDPSDEDLMALADAVRRAPKRAAESSPLPPGAPRPVTHRVTPPAGLEGEPKSRGVRGHLRVVQDTE